MIGKENLPAGMTSERADRDGGSVGGAGWRVVGVAVRQAPSRKLVICVTMRKSETVLESCGRGRDSDRCIYIYIYMSTPS